MSRSKKILAPASIIGAPVWLIPDARLTLGSPILYWLAIVSFGGALLGLALWQLDRK